MAVEAAVLVPNWKLPPSGGRKGLHFISKVLRDNGVDCVTVGSEYEYSVIGDKVIPAEDFAPNKGTVCIIPEGVTAVMGTDYFLDLLDRPHGSVVMYVQNYKMADKHEEWTTHYWSLGQTHRDFVRKVMEIPADTPIEELQLPVDTDWWEDAGKRRIPGSVLYTTARNQGALDSVARKCGGKPVFRVAGATQDELRTIMALSDIFILASTSEGQSCILNEAMSMEIACVTWPSGGLPDIITHEQTGLMVRQNDVVGLADCVKRLQNDPQLARKLGKNARQWCIEHLSIEGFESRVMELWAKVC